MSWIEWQEIDDAETAFCVFHHIQNLQRLAHAAHGVDWELYHRTQNIIAEWVRLLNNWMAKQAGLSPDTRPGPHPDDANDA